MIGLYLAVVLLLGAAGVAKFRRPETAATALRSIGVGMKQEAVARVIAAIEIGIATIALTVSGPVPALAIGSVYLLFTAVVLELLRRGHRSVSCGCFGQESAQVSPLHVVLDSCAAGAAFAAALMGTALPDLYVRPALEALAIVAVSLVLSYVLYVAMTLLPTVLREALRDKREARGGPAPFRMTTNGSSPSVM